MYEDLLNCGYCECNELNCLGNNPPKKILNIMKEQQQEIERLNNIINEFEKDIKNLYTYGIKNNAEQRDYLLNRLEELKEYKGSDE